MADLPRDIGFDDDPVVLINYVMLDELSDSRETSIESPTHKPHRDRTRSDSSLTSGKARRRSKSTSASELSSYEGNSSENISNWRRQQMNVQLDITPETHGTKPSISSLKSLEEGEEQHDFEHNSPITTNSDFKRVQRQNRELVKKNQQLSKTIDDLKKERELLVWERDKLKKGGENTSGEVCLLSEEDQLGRSEREETISTLRNELAIKDEQIASLQQQLVDRNKVPQSQQLSEDEDTTELNVNAASYQQRVTLSKLMDEQMISSRLRVSNSELQLKVATLEREMEKLQQQNTIHVQMLEQANTIAAQAAAGVTKQKKKSSLFGLRRSGRKNDKSSRVSNDQASITPPSITVLSTSQPSLEGSLSEHDLNMLLLRRNEATYMENISLRNPFNKGVNMDAELLHTGMKLVQEEKQDLERHLECLREELTVYQNKIDEFIEERKEKESSYLDVVQQFESVKQALQLTTREKELLVSENEGLSYEVDSLRAEKDALKGKEVKAVLKEKQEMEFLRSENKALMSEVRTLITNSDGLETSLSQLKRENITRDVREHELKLKMKRLEIDKEKYRHELAEVKQFIDNRLSNENTSSDVISVDKPPHGSPRKTQIKTGNSPTSPIKQYSPSTGQHQMVKSHQKKPSWPPVVTQESLVTPQRTSHERAQSEDLSSSVQLPNSASNVGMKRTSSGGVKAVAVQKTLPKKETALKVSDKALSVPTLSVKGSDSAILGAFHPTSPKSSGVNSLVKMFESGEGTSGTSSEVKSKITSQDNKTITESDNINDGEKEKAPPSETLPLRRMSNNLSPQHKVNTSSSTHTQSRDTSPGKQVSPSIRSNEHSERSPSKERKTSSGSPSKLSHSEVKSQSKKDESRRISCGDNRNTTELVDSKAIVEDNETFSTLKNDIGKEKDSSSKAPSMRKGSTGSSSPRRKTSTSSKHSQESSPEKQISTPIQGKEHKERSPSKERKAKSPSKERKLSTGSARRLSQGNSDFTGKKDETSKIQSSGTNQSSVITTHQPPDEKTDQSLQTSAKHKSPLRSTSSENKESQIDSSKHNQSPTKEKSPKPISSDKGPPYKSTSSDGFRRQISSSSLKDEKQEPVLQTIDETESTKSISTTRNGVGKTLVTKQVSKFSVTKKDDKKVLVNISYKKDVLPTEMEKSQTWPTKSVHDNSKTGSTTNTLPMSSPSEKKRTSPTQLTPLAITKPKPPPTVYSKVMGVSTPTSDINTPSCSTINQSNPQPIPQDSVDQSWKGNVSNLRSSWEKKAQFIPPTSYKPLPRTGNGTVLNHKNERSESFNVTSPNTLKPITKTGNGPAGVIISSPSNNNRPSPHPQSNTPVTSTVQHLRQHRPLTKTGSFPLTTTTVTNNPTSQQNGTPSSSYTKTTISQRIASFENQRSSSVEDLVDSISEDLGDGKPKSPQPVSNNRNGTTPSPRLSRRPASLYVGSVSEMNIDKRDKRLSSLITILQEKSLGPSPSPPPLPSENKSPVPTVRLTHSENFQKQNNSPVISRTMYDGPKLQRTVSLSSPVNRRSKKSKLLRWCQIMTDGYDNISITNFSDSFSNGLAFCALLHHFVPEKIPYSTLDPLNQRANFKLAFEVAESIGIPALLDIDDMVSLDVPDWMSVMTYVSYIYNCFANVSQS